MAKILKFPVGKAKDGLPKLIRQVEAGGTEIILTRHGQDVARIAPIVPSDTPDVSTAVWTQSLRRLHREAFID